MGIATGYEDIVGTDDADILIALARIAREHARLTGGAGDDVLIAGHAPLTVDEGVGNGSRETAFGLDDPGLWTTTDDLLVGDSAVAHTTIVGTGAGEADWFSFTVDRRCTVTFDIDFAGGGYGGLSWDSWIAIWNGEQNLWNSDDAASALGGLGSVVLRDTFFSADFRPGTYQIELFGFGLDRVVPEGGSYLLNISALRHATTAEAPAAGGVLHGGVGQDYLVGAAGEDVLAGGSGADLAYAGGGADILTGGGGRDVLDGGDGADRLTGGAGSDALTGGAGTDRFVIRRAVAGQVDTLADFTVGEDVIALDARGFGLLKGALDPSAFHLGATAADADDRILYDAAAGSLLFDLDGAGGAAAVQFATLTGAPVLDAGVLIVI